MRIVNQRTEHDNYVNAEKTCYDTFVTWINLNINEQVKSKAKIIQSLLLDYFKEHKKPTFTQVQTFCNSLKSQYLPNTSYNDISIVIVKVNSLDNDKTFYFDIFIDFNGIYQRQLIQSNCMPNNDGKPIILDIEITDDELDERIKQQAIIDGDFEEI